MEELRRCDFDFSRLSNQIAARDAELPAAELVANLRDDSMHHWTPPGGGYAGALNHVVIHGLDVTVPLGVPRSAPRMRPSGSSLTASPRAVATHTSAPTFKDGASMPATLTGPTDRARHSAARPKT